MLRKLTLHVAGHLMVLPLIEAIDKNRVDLAELSTRMLPQLGHFLGTFIGHIREPDVIAAMVVVKERESDFESLMEEKCFRV